MAEQNQDKGSQFIQQSFIRNSAFKENVSAQNRNVGIFSAKGAKEIISLNKQLTLLNKNLKVSITAQKKDFIKREDPNAKLIASVDDLEELMRDNNKLMKKQFDGKKAVGGLLGGLSKLIAVGGLLGFLLSGKQEFLFSVVKGFKKVFFDIPGMFKNIFSFKGIFSGFKAIGKTGGKGLGKTFLKKIPGIGTLLGIFFGIERFKKGDVLGGIGEIASGVASMFPGVGTIISTVIDAALLMRDFKHIFGKDKGESIKKSSPMDWRKIPVIGSFIDVFDGIKLMTHGSPVEGTKMALLGLNAFKIPGLDFVISKTLFPLIDASVWLGKKGTELFSQGVSAVKTITPMVYDQLKEIPVIGQFISGIEGIINFAKNPKEGLENLVSMVDFYLPGSGAVLSDIGGMVMGVAGWLKDSGSKLLGKGKQLGQGILASEGSIRSGLTGSKEKPGDRNIGSTPKSIRANVSDFIKDKATKVAEWLGIVARKNVDFSGVHPSVMNNFTGMAEDYYRLTGQSIQVNSAYRNPEQQKKLYEDAKRTGRTGFVARPGRSLHEYGYAIDINSADANKAEKLGLMQKWGFARPLLNAKNKEPWHIEPKGIDRKAVRNEPDTYQVGDRNLPSRVIGDRIFPNDNTPIDLSDRTINLLAEAMQIAMKGSKPNIQTPRVSFNTSMRD